VSDELGSTERIWAGGVSRVRGRKGGNDCRCARGPWRQLQLPTSGGRGSGLVWASTSPGCVPSPAPFVRRGGRSTYKLTPATRWNLQRTFWVVAKGGWRIASRLYYPKRPEGVAASRLRTVAGMGPVSLLGPEVVHLVSTGRRILNRHRSLRVRRCVPWLH
jgi:hypothetical protein